MKINQGAAYRMYMRSNEPKTASNRICNDFISLPKDTQILRLEAKSSSSPAPWGPLSKNERSGRRPNYSILETKEFFKCNTAGKNR